MSSGPVKICAISGGSGAGKTTLAVKILERLGDAGTHLTIDWYYHDLAHMTPADRAAVNYDHPSSREVDLFAEHLGVLASGAAVEAPIYDFATHTRSAETTLVRARPCIVTEGIHLLGLETVRTQCALCVFIDVDADIRLERRIRRDVAERGRTAQSVREQWLATVAPMHDQFVQPSLEFADRIVTVDEDFDVVAHELAKLLVPQPFTTGSA